MLSQRRTKNKKGLSVIIGYVLLMTISIVMSALVYQWLKTYVPKDTIECEDGTSLMIKNLHYDCTSTPKRLVITLKNNGKFKLDGYFIRASTGAGDELAVLDLAKNLYSTVNPAGLESSPLTEEGKKILTSNSEIRFQSSENWLSPDSANEQNEDTKVFDVSTYGELKKIEIIPTRYIELDKKKRFASCNDAKITETLACATT
jgi:hypothetical protein